MSVTHTLTELARLAGVTPRTVRYYIGQGLLRPASRSGPGAAYDDEQLQRLLLIRRLQRQHLPLAEIRARLAELAPAQVSELLAEPDPDTRHSTALEYIRQHLAPPAPSPVSATNTLASMPTMQRPPSVGPMRHLALHRSPPAGASPGEMAPLAEAASPVVSMTSSVAEARGELRSTWDRIELTADIELHVRRPLDRRGNRIVDQILTFARDLLAAD